MTQIALDAGLRTSAKPHPGMGFGQFVSLVAALMAINAIAVDAMLPALPAIAHSLQVAAGNQQQWVVTIYLVAFGSAQIIYGPLSDRFGRRPVLVTGLVIYVAMSILAATAGSFEMLLFARACQGVGSAATRVLVVSIVRDCYAGNQMARVMSLAFIVFLAVPILAPSIGQIVMLAFPWRAIFAGLAVFGSVVLLWVLVRLPETLHPGDRLPFAPDRVGRALAVSLTNRSAVGYMLAMMFIMGGLFGFINSAQQIFVTTFGAPRLFTAIFAGIAFFMAMASLLNSRIVGRLGTRPVSHCALIGYLAVAVVHVATLVAGRETLWSFALLQAGEMFCFGLVASNFGALAMEPLGHVAGTASSIQGFVTTAGGAFLGSIVGQHYDGTTRPLTIGFLIFGMVALAFVLFSERGRLFRRANPRTAM